MLSRKIEKGDKSGRLALSLARLGAELRAPDAFDPVPEHCLQRPRLPPIPSRWLLRDLYDQEMQQVRRGGRTKTGGWGRSSCS